MSKMTKDEGSPKTNAEFPLAAEDLNLAIKAFRLDIERGLEICFPACIYSYDRLTHTAQVMPLVKMGYFYNEWYYQKREIFSVSVRNIQCGGITVDIPLYIGDTGWVISSDRDTYLLKQECALTNSVLANNRPIEMIENDYQQVPNQTIIHSFSHGFFIPDNWGKWMPNRYKDNPAISVANAFYMGSSFDTADEPEYKDGQKGDEYEKKSTASFVIQPSGGAYMASSVQDENKQSCLFEATGKTAAMSATDLKTNRMSRIELDSQEGILIRQDDDTTRSNFICSLKPDCCKMRFYQKGQTVSLAIEQGKICIGTSDDVMIRTEKNLIANCNEADLNCKGDINVSASGTFNVKGDGGVNINSCDSVNVASANSINLTAAEKVNLMTGGALEIMSKAESAKINVTTLSKDAQINIKTEGESSDITLDAQKADVRIVAKKTIGLDAQNIEFRGALDIVGSMQLNSKSFSPLEKHWTYE